MEGSCREERVMRLTKEEFENNRKAYTTYLLMCVKLGDWHGVSDAANDLRVLEAQWNTQNSAKQS